LCLSEHAKQAHYAKRWLTDEVYVRWRGHVHLEPRQQGALREEMWVVAQEPIVVAQQRKAHSSIADFICMLVAPSTLVGDNHLEIDT